MPQLERHGAIHVLDLGANTNLVNPGWIAGVNAALDEAVDSAPPRGLVTTASGDFFGMGFDLQWMAANPDGVAELVAAMHEVCARMLELPLPTVAALRGHAIAGGALFALAHDYRLMRDGDCFFCLPEIDVRIAVSPGLIELVKARLSAQVAHEALTTGHRYTAVEAADAGIVQRVAASDETLDAAIALAEELSEKHAATYGALKSRLYTDTLRALRDADANAADVGKFEYAMTALGIAAPGYFKNPS